MAYSYQEGVRVNDTDANRLNRAFLGQRIGLIGHKRPEIPEADASGSKYRYPLNAIRYQCPLWGKSGHRGTSV